jgi:hypothetical protein
MKTMSALEGQGENIDRWEEVVDGINQVNSYSYGITEIITII